MRALLICLAALAAGAAAPIMPGDCSAPEFRQFDFWAGEWEIGPHDDDAQHTGVSTISLEQDGCVLVERYRAVTGEGAMSLTGYDARRGVWRHSWSSNTGSVAYVEGGVRADGVMELTNLGLASSGGAGVVDRITWFAEADGAVRQSWATSNDGGATWTVLFDDRYRRATE